MEFSGAFDEMLELAEPIRIQLNLIRGLYLLDAKEA